MGYRYEEVKCKRCGAEALHRIRRRCYFSTTTNSFAVKYESWHCLKCNKYWKKR